MLSTSSRRPWLYRIAFAAVLLTAVILPRLAALGDFISLDEGYHEFMAAYINQSYLAGNGFPREMTGYKLYPYLLFWLWNLPGNGVVWIRLADLAVAAGMGYVFCQMLIRESGSRWIGLIIGFSCLIGLNYAGAINNGFKNSFFPSFLCLCAAVNIARDAAPASRRWYWAGALTALAILFRETFVLFPIIGVCALLFAGNYQALWRFIAGGIGAACLITLISALLRRQTWGILEFYFTYGKIYGPEAGKRIMKFLQNGGRALVIYGPILFLALISMAGILKKGQGFKRMFFWLACALAPIVEPYLKIGFLYHFSACLPALGGLCAYGYSQRPQKPKFFQPVYIWCAAICAAVMLPYTAAQYQKLPTTLTTLKAFPAKGWPQELTGKSTTLEAASAIDEILPPNGKVSSSGFAYFIFPASLAFPPAIKLGDLSRTYIYANEDKEKFIAALALQPPDVVLLAKTDEDHSATFHPQLKAIFDELPDYVFYKSIDPDPDKDYGWLGYDIYRKRPKK